MLRIFKVKGAGLLGVVLCVLGLSCSDKKGDDTSSSGQDLATSFELYSVLGLTEKHIPPNYANEAEKVVYLKLLAGTLMDILQPPPAALTEEAKPDRTPTQATIDSVGKVLTGITEAVGGSSQDDVRSNALELQVATEETREERVDHFRKRLDFLKSVEFAIPSSSDSEVALTSQLATSLAQVKKDIIRDVEDLYSLAKGEGETLDAQIAQDGYKVFKRGRKRIRRIIDNLRDAKKPEVEILAIVVEHSKLPELSNPDIASSDKTKRRVARREFLAQRVASLKKSKAAYAAAHGVDNYEAIPPAEREEIFKEEIRLEQKMVEKIQEHSTPNAKKLAQQQIVRFRATVNPCVFIVGAQMGKCTSDAITSERANKVARATKLIAASSVKATGPEIREALENKMFALHMALEGKGLEFSKSHLLVVNMEWDGRIDSGEIDEEIALSNEEREDEATEEVDILIKLRNEMSAGGGGAALKKILGPCDDRLSDDFDLTQCSQYMQTKGNNEELRPCLEALTGKSLPSLRKKKLCQSIKGELPILKAKIVKRFNRHRSQPSLKMGDDMSGLIQQRIDAERDEIFEALRQADGASTVAAILGIKTVVLRKLDKERQGKVASLLAPTSSSEPRPSSPKDPVDKGEGDSSLSGGGNDPAVDDAGASGSGKVVLPVGGTSAAGTQRGDPKLISTTPPVGGAGASGGTSDVGSEKTATFSKQVGKTSAAGTQRGVVAAGAQSEPLKSEDSAAGTQRGVVAAGAQSEPLKSEDSAAGTQGLGRNVAASTGEVCENADTVGFVVDKACQVSDSKCSDEDSKGAKNNKWRSSAKCRANEDPCCIMSSKVGNVTCFKECISEDIRSDNEWGWTKEGGCLFGSTKRGCGSNPIEDIERPVPGAIDELH